MTSLITFITGLLTAALSLMGFVQAHPELPQSSRDQVVQVAEQAVGQANGVIASSTSATSNTVSWKIYTNAKWKFSFKYPSDWKYDVYGSDQSQNKPPFVYGSNLQNKYSLIHIDILDLSPAQLLGELKKDTHNNVVNFSSSGLSGYEVRNTGDSHTRYYLELGIKTIFIEFSQLSYGVPPADIDETIREIAKSFSGV